jgi:alkaline phosphatase D
MRLRFPDGELGRWASLGAVSERSVRVWLRDPSGEPQQAILEIDGVERGAVTLTPSSEHDWTAAGDLHLDRPRPNAHFTVRVAGFKREGRFAPLPDTPAEFTFAFGSCHQPFGPPRDGTLTLDDGAGIYRPMDATLTAHEARFLALTGDQIYSDGVEPIDVRAEARRARPAPSDEELRDRYRWLYRGYFNVSAFRVMLEARPTLMSWDDHDITEGWGALIEWDELDMRVFRAAEATYREYQHVRHIGASVEEQATYHRSFWFGDVGFFVLDLRGVRSYRDGRLMGEQQWRDLYRFFEQASERATQTIFVVAGVPVVHHAPALVRLAERIRHKSGTDLRDRWSATPIAHERVRFLELLLDWQSARPSRQVAVLSGDVHAGAAFRVKRRTGPGEILQWTSSPLSTHAALPAVIASVIGSKLVNLGEDRYRSTRSALVRGNNFGLVQVAPRRQGGHRIQLSLYEYTPGRGIRVAARVAATPSQ